MFRRNLVLLVCGATLFVSCSEPDPGRSRLKLSSTPCSEVWINGERAGETPLNLRLKPGRYEVIFKRAGFEDHVSSFPLPARAEVEITAELVAVDALGFSTIPDDPSQDLLDELKEVCADLQAFFADLGVRPPGALAEVVRVADSGVIPTQGADLAQYRKMLLALADAIETIGTDDALAIRVRGVMARLE